MNTLIDNLRYAGKHPVPVSFPDGSRVLVLPENGRLLGLCPAEDDTNFLWTNPELTAAESAKAYFARCGWRNLGGDRTWLAPETDLFIGDLKRVAETYAVQSALDPGQWKLGVASAAEVSLVNETRVRLHRQNRDVGVRLAKTYSVAPNPLRDVAGLQYAGYTLATTLEVEPQPGVPTRLGIWNLLQLPSPGTMLIPTRAPARPHVVFGALAADELTVTPGLVRWNMVPPGGDAKISLKPQPLTGLVGYRRASDTPGMQDLVARVFSVGNERDYVDALWESPHEAGWAFQACCVRSGAECFNELEYHAPAVAARSGEAVIRDESRVWAFRGPKEAVAMAARQLLGNAVIE
ncbi:MAG TPA: hypothetical protein VMX97_01760 [Hyphomicrobiaceae bacterium]|nr:hypothetical protein [Hyphomicrobiaceae bacterium]